VLLLMTAPPYLIPLPSSSISPSFRQIAICVGMFGGFIYLARRQAWLFEV
jgi:hypothetical protein